MAADGGGGVTGDAGDTSAAGAAASAAGTSGGAPSDASVDAGLADDGGMAGVLLDAAALDGGTSADCAQLPGVLFCSGFENSTFSDWDYTILQNGTLSQSTTLKRTGVGALHATTGDAGPNNAARYANISLAQRRSGDAWLRFYYYVPSTVVVTTHFSAGVISEISKPYDGFSLLVRPTDVAIGSMSGTFDGTMAFPRDRWVCVELHVQIDPSAGRFEAYLDGALAVRSPPTNTLPAGGFTSAEVGIHYTEPNQGPVEVYVDDAAVGTARLPCD